MNEEIINAVEGHNILQLREMAGEFSDEASISQDLDNINLALITYSLNKIFGKIHLREKTQKLTETVIKNLQKKDYPATLDAIYTFDNEHGLFHDGLENKSRVKIGSRIYAQGISLAQAASLVGIPSNEIMDYIGDTKEHDTQHGISLEERFHLARDILK